MQEKFVENIPLRERARQCRMLAAGVSSRHKRDRLIALAIEYEGRANCADYPPRSEARKPLDPARHIEAFSARTLGPTPMSRRAQFVVIQGGAATGRGR